MPVIEGFVTFDRQQSNGKRNYKKYLWGIYKSPLLFCRCFVSPRLTKMGPAAAVCSVKQRQRKRRGGKEGHSAKDKGKRREGERARQTKAAY